MITDLEPDILECEVKWALPAPPRHAHGDMSSLALHERLPEILVVPREKTPTGAAPKKDVLLIIGDWNAKVGSQEAPGVTGKFGLGVQNEAGQRPALPREHTGHSKHPFPITKEKTLHMDITRWSTPKSD